MGIASSDALGFSPSSVIALGLWHLNLGHYRYNSNLGLLGIRTCSLSLPLFEPRPDAAQVVFFFCSVPLYLHNLLYNLHFCEEVEGTL